MTWWKAISYYCFVFDLIIALTFCLRSIPRAVSRLASSIASLDLALSRYGPGVNPVVGSLDAPARVILLIYKSKEEKTADML